MAAVVSVRGPLPESIGIGFIGCGDISTLHAAAISECDGAALIGLWNHVENDTAAGGAAFTATGRAHDFGCERFSTVDALLGDGRINAVYVLTPLSTHRAYVLLALRAGKHVLVEKPAGATAGEIAEMQQEAESRALALCPGHNYVYEDQLRRIRRMVDDGDLGRITQPPSSTTFTIRKESPLAIRASSVRS